MTHATARLTAGTAGIWVPAAVILLTRARWSDDLPERIGTHWGSLTAAADDFNSTDTFYRTVLAVALVAAVVAVATAATRPKHPATRSILAWSGFVAGTAAGIWVASATATLAAPQAPVLSWRFGYSLVGMSLGLVVAQVVGRTGVAAAPKPLETLDLGPTERAAYRGTLHSRPLMWASAVATVVIVLSSVSIAPGQWLLLAAPVGTVAFFGRIRVTADTRGLRVTAGWTGLPIVRIPLERIASAQAQTIRPMQWGGWGLRAMPGRSALVLRGGPGLVLDLRDGRRFAVTLDDPDSPARLLNALVERSRQ